MVEWTKEDLNMTYDEYKTRLHKLIFTCGMNQRYHYRLEWRWGFADKAVKIVVLIIAVIGLIYTIPNLLVPIHGVILAIFGVFAAGVLNIIPTGEWERFHGEMSRLWSDLLGDAIQEEHKTGEAEDENGTYAPRIDRLCELVHKEDALNANEPEPWVDGSKKIKKK